MCSCALKIRGFTRGFWALVFLVAFCGCKSKSSTPNPQSPEECKTIEQNSAANAKLLQIFSSCKNKEIDTPILFAHFLQQTLKEDVCIDDVMSNTGGRHICSPGPFRIEEGSSADVSDKQWSLEALPDYFVWRLDFKDTVDENFLITNQSAFPVKSQSFKLQNGDETILVLLPNKNALTPGSRYFIYLTVNSKDAPRRWVQPFTILPASKTAG